MKRHIFCGTGCQTPAIVTPPGIPVALPCGLALGFLFSPPPGKDGGVVGFSMFFFSVPPRPVAGARGCALPFGRIAIDFLVAQLGSHARFFKPLAWLSSPRFAGTLQELPRSFYFFTVTFTFLVALLYEDVPAAVTVIVHLPFFTAVILPLELTFATFVFEDL